MTPVLPCLLVLLASLAGCASQAPEAIRVSLPDDPTKQPVRLSTDLTARTHRWSVDGVVVGEGPRAEWVPGVRNHTAVVVLETEEPDDRHERTVVLGTGTNRPPSIDAASSADWVVPGEVLHLHAEASDLDRDPVHVSWACERAADLRPQSGDPPLEDTPLRGHDQVVRVEAELPASGPTASCGKAMDGSTWSVEGWTPGFYILVARATDGADTVTAALGLYVTQTRPSPTENWTFAGTLAVGRDLLGPAAEGNEQQYQADHAFEPPLRARQATFQVTVDEGAACVVFPDEPGPPPCVAEGRLNLRSFQGGEERVRVELLEGFNAEYELRLILVLDMDPDWLYEPVEPDEV